MRNNRPRIIDRRNEGVNEKNSVKSKEKTLVVR